MLSTEEIDNIIFPSVYSDIKDVAKSYYIVPESDERHIALKELQESKPEELPESWKRIIDCLDHSSLHLAFKNGLSPTDEKTKTMVHHLVRTCALDGNVPSLCVMLYIMESKGVDVNGQDEDGNTPLHLCNMWLLSQEDDNVFHRVMILFGADVTIRNNEGKTPGDIFDNLPERSSDDNQQEYFSDEE